MLQALNRKLTLAGFDLIQPFLVSRYNARVEARYAIPVQEGLEPVAFLIGNTKALWTPFITYLSHQYHDWKNQSNASAAQFFSNEMLNPIDQYTEYVIRSSVLQVLSEIELSTTFSIHYSHDYEHLVSMQQICAVSGLAAYLPEAGLCVHSKYGPWFALRAAVVFHVPNTECHESWTPSIPMLPGQLSDTKIIQELQKHRPDLMSIKPAESWRAWLAFRRQVALFAETDPSFEYSQEQILYHYTQRRDVLHPLIQ